LGDSESPVTPWQLEQTWRASVSAGTSGLPTSRERSGSAQAVSSSKTAAALSRSWDFIIGLSRGQYATQA
jgi:hypothetical protein